MKKGEELSFRGIWAGAHLFFSLSSLDWHMAVSKASLDIPSVSKILIPILAIFVLIRPQSSILFLGMALAQLTEAYFALPEIPNHRHIVSFLNLAICFRIMVPTSTTGTFNFIRGVGTRLAIVAYFFATFAKLNTAFLDPSTSCAASFYDHIKDIFSFAPTGDIAYKAIIIGTIIVEGFFVLGLIIPRLRGITVTIGAIFHAALALDFFKHFVDFTAVMISLLWLFKGIRFIGERERKIMALAFLVVMALGVLCLAEPSLFILYGTFLFILFVMWVAPLFSGDSAVLSVLPRIGVAGCLILALSILSGLGPYIGYKTRGALTMYSNLLITDESSNHILIPKSLDMFGFLGDSVELVRSNRFPLSGHAENGVSIPRVELLRKSAKDRDFSAEFRGKSGEEQRVTEGFRQEGLNLPWWIRKFTIFRPVGEPVADQCVW